MALTSLILYWGREISYCSYTGAVGRQVNIVSILLAKEWPQPRYEALFMLGLQLANNTNGSMLV